MKVAIITIGDELLIGQTINTNLTWLGKTLEEAGLSVIQSTTVQDREDAIIKALDNLLKDFDLVIITGGLGPTNDDITKATLAKYFNRKMVLNRKVLERVQQIFSNRKMEMPPSNIQQAVLPEGIIILDNIMGTAPGMWFESNNKIIISLPGVPYEMKYLTTNEVIPLLKSRFDLSTNYYQTLMIQGIGESSLAELIKEWEDRLTNDNLHLAYLPSPGILKLRLNSINNEPEIQKINSYFEELKTKFPQYVYGENEISIFEVVGELLKKKNASLGTIESCTGGDIARSFVKFPGSSDFFIGGLITYSNALKIKLAHVDPKILEDNGAVSEEVAKEMAIGGQKQLGVDYAIAVTGIAGPDGGTEDNPVGTVWIAVASPEKVVARHFLFGDDRRRNIEKAKLAAVNLLRKVILGIE